ncbi:hypothetical protein DL93DRAFT_2152611 [Clavulina sp. PMI_390]|nr:hypothetical protein DL93DRAFT_2152611 [Clavulina sp. PMI_390]
MSDRGHQPQSGPPPRRMSRVFVELPLPPRPSMQPHASSAMALPAPASASSLKRKLVGSGDENTHNGPAPTLGASSSSAGLTQLLESRATKKPRVEVVITSKPPTIQTLLSASNTFVLPSVNTTLLPKKLPKVAPAPQWTPIPDCFDREYVERLVFIREFTHRFHAQLKIARLHLDTLNLFEPITEQTCKALLIGLLNIVYTDEKSAEPRKLFAQSLKTLKGAKINLDDMLTAIRDVEHLLTVALADPLSQDVLDDSLLVRRTTRTGPQDIVHPDQLIPVIISLMEEALHTSGIRQELDDGMKEMVRIKKDRAAEVAAETERFTALKNEANEERDKAKQNLPHDAAWQAKLKEARDSHKVNSTEIAVRYNAELQGHTLRFGSLGTDHDGRTYYALSHPRAIASGPTKTKGRKPKPTAPSPPSPAERESLANWAYFVFVWGKRPASASAVRSGGGASEASNPKADKDIERWWAFSTSESIHVLSKWISTTAVYKDEEAAMAVPAAVSRDSSSPLTPLDDSDTAVDELSSKAGKDGSLKHAQAVKPLCKSLEEFADFLDVCYS